jgi:hypothetical protein
MVTALFERFLQPFQLIATLCGAVILVSLFIMKFVGPPPHGFVPRAALTALMLLLVLAATVFRSAATELMIVNLALGVVLLFWYVRE